MKTTVQAFFLALLLIGAMVGVVILTAQAAMA